MLNRTLVINIHTFTGEYINLNLHVEFVKRLKLVNNAFNYDLTGYIGEITTADNNHIELSIN